MQSIFCCSRMMTGIKLLVALVPIVAIICQCHGSPVNNLQNVEGRTSRNILSNPGEDWKQNLFPVETRFRRNPEAKERSKKGKNDEDDARENFAINIKDHSDSCEEEEEEEEDSNRKRRSHEPLMRVMVRRNSEMDPAKKGKAAMEEMPKVDNKDDKEKNDKNGNAGGKKSSGQKDDVGKVKEMGDDKKEEGKNGDDKEKDMKVGNNDKPKEGEPKPEGKDQKPEHDGKEKSKDDENKPKDHGKEKNPKHDNGKEINHDIKNKHHHHKHGDSNNKNDDDDHVKHSPEHESTFSEEEYCDYSEE